MVKTTSSLTGIDIDTDDIPNYLRELADAVENDDIYIKSVADSKLASADELVERKHRITYTTTDAGIDLFNTRLIKLLDEDWEGDTDG